MEEEPIEQIQIVQKQTRKTKPAANFEEIKPIEPEFDFDTKPAEKQPQERKKIDQDEIQDEIKPIEDTPQDNQNYPENQPQDYIRLVHHLIYLDILFRF